MKPSISRASMTGAMPTAAISSRQYATAWAFVRGAGAISTSGIT